jgi:NAD(P)-dependent dehydrogenase (short-subunit alcohol dehydrogenase family)
MEPRHEPPRGLYLITPDETDTGRLLARVAPLLGAGVAWLQYRNKAARPALRGEQAAALQALCASAGVPLLVNDTATLALAAGAAGAHLGEDDGDIAAARALAETLAAAEVRLDAVFVNAGAAKFAAYPDVDEALWDQIFNTNIKGPYFQLQALLPLLNPGASVVINGSINARIGMPNTSVYAASKAAVISLARTLSAELLPRGVRVNVLSPGPVSTPIYTKLGLDAAALDATAAQIQSQIPLGRFGTPEEIAATVLHLSSPESAFIVGTEIIADGGMSQL